MFALMKLLPKSRVVAFHNDALDLSQTSTEMLRILAPYRWFPHAGLLP